MVGDTNPINASKTCSRCEETKEFDKFIKNRNICKQCDNARKNAKYNELKAMEPIDQTCTECDETKSSTSFIIKRTICKECNNKARRNKYETNEEHRLRTIKQATDFKHEKAIERKQKKLEEIGEGNKKCSNCSTIKSDSNFRHNRLKCKVCERDEPITKFKRAVRCRIWYALTSKTMHTIEYLGINSTDYLEWILTYNENYNLENRGTEWHIDHVIPLSRFDLEDEAQQLIAFNWRNTMPLSCKENLSKNNKIIPQQIKEHMTYLSKYHASKNINMPKEFIDLFAKHLVDGNPLKQSLPLQFGNILEEHG
jgi:uncharacterized protein (DUF983 family)